MKRLAVVLLGFVLLVGCAKKIVLPPLPHDVQLTIETVSNDKTLTPDQKTQLIKEVIASTERI